MKPSDLRDVLVENRSYFRQIAEHSRGGRTPSIVGLPAGADRVLSTDAGRQTSKELIDSIKDLRAELQRWDQWEAQESKKRPLAALTSHVEVSSTFISAYVARVTFLLESSSS